MDHGHFLCGLCSRRSDPGALTDRIDAKRIYLVGSAATFTGHLIFAWLADGFWTALLARALAEIGWAAPR